MSYAPLSLTIPLSCLCLSLATSVAWANGHPPAPESHAAKPASKPAPVGDNMDGLRQKLAERLGASQPTEAKQPNVMRVTNPTAHAEAAPKLTGSADDLNLKAGHQAAPKAAPKATGGHGAPARKASQGGHDAAPAAAPSDHGGGHATHWSYQGEGGPTVWGQLKPEFAKCAIGQRQSPIDIRGGIPVQLDPIEFDYRPTGFGVIDNGHTIQVNVPAGNAITVQGRRYDLLQFHFHRPSEERINGRQFDMVAHLVHKDPEGRLAVVAVLLDRGIAQPVIQAVWNNLPLEKGEESAAPTVIDLNKLLPEDRRYYTYMGSLTTPPCSEGVLWLVLKTPAPISPEQINIFARLYPMNARPIQQASGRVIKESN